MKRILFFCLFIFSIYTLVAQEDAVTETINDSVMSQIADTDVSANATIAAEAIEAYNEGDFRKAIEILENERAIQLEKGLESSALYYNLGNAYFRVNDLAHARLNYERALLLDPGDRDIRHNIDYLSTKIEDKILIADTFFLNIWFRSVQNLYSSDTWATIAVIFFIILITCLVLFFFGRLIVIKKIAFYTGIVCLVVVILSNIFAFRQKHRIEYRDTAVVMAGSASVVSSPDINSKELFILHSGTKVFVTKEDRSWYEIEIDNGSIGWIQKDRIEVI